MKNEADNHQALSLTLQTYLQNAGLSQGEPVQVNVLAGGQSNPTYRLQVGARQMVLRKQPPGQLVAGAHAVDREYRVMRALAGSQVPVPAMLAYEADPGVLGTPFYLMDFLAGRVFMDPALPELAPAERSALYDEMTASSRRCTRWICKPSAWPTMAATVVTWRARSSAGASRRSS